MHCAPTYLTFDGHPSLSPEFEEPRVQSCLGSRTLRPFNPTSENMLCNFPALFPTTCDNCSIRAAARLGRHRMEAAARLDAFGESALRHRHGVSGLRRTLGNSLPDVEVTGYLRGVKRLALSTSPEQEAADGDDILRLYFAQWLIDDGLFLDLRPARFGVRGRTCLRAEWSLDTAATRIPRGHPRVVPFLLQHGRRGS